VLGFLGVNGAGKTTSMEMITGNRIPTRGSGSIKGKSITTEQAEVRKHIGYCPQFDALLPEMTAFETLALYARIKGVPENKVEDYCAQQIQQLGLSEFAARPCGGYSGGNKRKLSVGVALMGNPDVVFLDEPSTGMDPGAKRFMWGLIASTSQRKAVVLTTHSLEEAEALCTEITIMVNGRLRCLGTPQHIRSRFGQGYELEITFSFEKEEGKSENEMQRQEEILNFLKNSFEFERVQEYFPGHLKVKIGRSQPLGAIFRTVEANKERMGINEYAAREFSLEQIFLNFAQEQNAGNVQTGGNARSGANVATNAY